tara:strand:+ start:898 stop:1167 length:270 start_codon:yes stop_codon:yes gene_type:complete
METAEALAPFLAGPASAVFVMLILLLGLWKLTTEKLIPMMGAALDRHLNTLDELVATNKADHKAMVECLQRIEVKIDVEREEGKLKAVH